MRQVGRIFAWLLLIAALCAMGYELVLWADRGNHAYVALGRIVFELAPDFLPNLQAGVQRNLHPALWEHVLQPWLLLPGWVALGVPGIVLAVLCSRRKRRRFIR